VTSLPVPIGPAQLKLFNYLGLILAPAFLIIQGGTYLRASVLALALAALPSLLMLAEPSDESFLRLAGWFLLLGACGPLISSPAAVIYRRAAFHSTLYILHAICIVSLLLFVGGIKLGGRGDFSGIMSHSMILGPVAALSIIDSVRRTAESRSIYWFLVIVVEVSVGCMASSRSALIGAVLASATLLIFSYSKARIYIFVCAILLVYGVNFIETESPDQIAVPEILTGSFTQTLTGGLMAKGGNNTRKELWAARVQEFEENPLTGVGFSQTVYGRKSEEATQVEPGSSFLAILSMTGIVGFAGWIVLGLAMVAGLGSWRQVSLDEKSKIIGFAVFFAFHMCFEGYALACGSFLAMLFWFWLSYAWDQLDESFLNLHP
jgi:hypothetical protein